MAFSDFLDAVRDNEYVAIRCSDEQVSLTPLEAIEIEDRDYLSRDMPIGSLYGKLRSFWDRYAEDLPDYDRVVGYVPGDYFRPGMLFMGTERQKVLEYAYFGRHYDEYECGL